MSRSYKKYPCVRGKSSKSSGFGKRVANKKVRKFKGELADGKAYRKLYCSWEICDYTWYKSWEDYWIDTLSEWKRRFDGLGWGLYDTCRGFPICCSKRTPEWRKENPELHKRKYYALWKREYCGK